MPEGRFWDPAQHTEVYASGAAFYVVLVKNGHGEAATEFAEWFLETFDLDLET